MATNKKVNVEYKTVDEKVTENYVSDFKKRYDMIKDLLFKSGGQQQAHIYLSSLFNECFNMGDILKMIGDEIEYERDKYKNGYVVSAKRWVPIREKDGLPYGCLDKDLKFCVRILDDKTDWSDILYVFPYMNGSKAFDISFKYDV